MRATGLQGDESSEIIEIIDDDTDAFSDRAPNITIHDTGGPRWVGPVAAAALVALIGYGIATSASSGAPKAAPAPSSTTPRPTTTPPPATTTTVPAPLVPYYSADPPREYSVSSAEIYEPNGFVDSPVTYQLWATEGSTASSGSWFSVESFSGRTFAIDAYRVETGERSIGVSHTSSGQAVAQFMASPYGSVTITSFGMSDDDLVRLAASVTVSRGSVTLTDPSLIPDFTLLSAVNPWLAVQGVPVESVFYQSNQDFNGGINLAVAPRLPPDQGGSTLDRQIALRFFLDNTTVFDVDGHVAVAGTLVSQYEFAVASWIAGDHIVTLSSSLTVPELVAIARTVHEVPLDEWQGMQFQATKHNADNNFGGFDQTQPAAVSFGTDAQSNPWVVKVSLMTFPNQRVVSWEWDTNGPKGIPSAADDTAKLSTVVENERTYVLADLPRAVAPTAQLQINRDGFDPVVVPFNDVSPDFDRTFAAYAFSEPTTYTAQIIGEDGTVLASWPRP